MFDIKLIDILQTICIGVFFLTLILLFYFLYKKFFVKDTFDETKFFTWLKDDLLKGNKETGYLLIATVIIYVLGSIASDLTERMTDSSNNKERNVILKELNYVSFMPSVSDIRKVTLIDNDDSLTTLGHSVFGNLELVRDANNINKTRFFLNEKDSIAKDSLDALARIYLLPDNRKKFDKFISLIYYTAKNWCFSKDHEPLTELKSIQIRIDLNRSIVLLVCVALQLIVLYYLIFVIRNFKKIFIKTPNDWKDIPKSVTEITLKSILVFFILGVLCRECFHICSLSYYKRAYGYYVSYLASKPESKTVVIPTDSLKNKTVSLYVP